jgi:TonB family protein
MINTANHMFYRRLANCLLVLLALGLSVKASMSVQYKVATVSEKTLRKFAKVTVMPEYPTESKRNGSQGVAVAELSIDEQGGVQKVQILEAPDEAIGNAVVKATSLWTFQPGVEDSTGKAIRLSGKLTFYFVIDAAGAHVRNPK